MLPADTFTVVDVKDCAGPPVRDGDRITVMYRAALTNADLDSGNVIETTYGPDVSLEIDVRRDSLLPGVYLALIGMHAGGAIRRVTMGSNLAFSDRGWGPVPASSGLVIELCVSRVVASSERTSGSHEKRVPK